MTKSFISQVAIAVIASLVAAYIVKQLQPKTVATNENQF